MDMQRYPMLVIAEELVSDYFIDGMNGFPYVCKLMGRGAALEAYGLDILVSFN